MSQNTRIIHVSDPHTSHRRLPAVVGDILIVSGDVSRVGSQAEFTDTLEWMRDYPCQTRILLPGNHDYFVEQETERAKILCRHFGVKLLIDELTVVDGLRIYGCPWVQYDLVYNWPPQDRAFCLNPEDPALARVYAAIPGDLDVLVCHAPPYGIGDSVWPGSYWSGLGVDRPGGNALLAYIDQHPELGCLLYGHVHENPGLQRYNRTWCSNAAGMLIQLDLDHGQLAGAGLFMMSPPV